MELLNQAPASEIVRRSRLKAGILVPGAFSGDPKKAVVTFTAPYPSVDYTIVALGLTDGSKTFAVATEGKTVNGFTVNLHSNNPANLIEVSWQTVLVE